MTSIILSDLIASISELKKNPMAVIRESKGQPVAILNRNEPVFYCISPELFALIQEKLEDEELFKIVEARSHEKKIEVDIDEL
jgi:antitoxin StbD